VHVRPKLRTSTAAAYANGKHIEKATRTSAWILFGAPLEFSP
jgi:hypothetical protein